MIPLSRSSIVKCNKIYVYHKLLSNYLHTEFHQEPSMMSSSTQQLDHNWSDFPFSRLDVTTTSWRRRDDFLPSDSRDRVALIYRWNLEAFNGWLLFFKVWFLNEFRSYKLFVVVIIKINHSGCQHDNCYSCVYCSFKFEC